MIDLRVMNDFADNKKLAIFEDLTRCIGEIDRALDPVAKAKLFCQAHRRVAHGNDSTRPAHFIDNVAAIVRLDLLLHGSHHIRRAEVHFFSCGCAAGNKIRAHEMTRRCRFSYSSKGPLGFSNAADVIITDAGGSGVLESSTRCTLDARVASSGCVVAMFTGVPILTSAKNFGAASPCKRMQPWVRGYGCTKP